MDRAYAKLDSAVYDPDGEVAAFNLSGPDVEPLTLKLSEAALLPLYAHLVQWMTGLAERRSGQFMRFAPAALDVGKSGPERLLTLDFTMPSGQKLCFAVPATADTLPVMKDAVAILEEILSEQSRQ